MANLGMPVRSGFRKVVFENIGPLSGVCTHPPGKAGPCGIRLHPGERFGRGNMDSGMNEGHPPTRKGEIEGGDMFTAARDMGNGIGDEEGAI